MTGWFALAAGLGFLLAEGRCQVPAYAFTNFVGSPPGVVADSAGHIDGVGSAARFNGPTDIALDGAGNAYVADAGNGVVRKISPTGVVSTLLGGTNGPTGIARFLEPRGIAVDTNTGTVFISDTAAAKIFKVTAAGVMSVLAGGGEGWSMDGTGTAASFRTPDGIALDRSGNLYVAENFGNLIRKVTPEGVVTSLAGDRLFSGTNDGVGAQARFTCPTGVAVDAAGNVYVADSCNARIRKVTPEGVVTTVAGAVWYAVGGDGPGFGGSFYLPRRLAVDSLGNIFVADILNHSIRKVTPAGVITTVAGVPGQVGSADGAGSGARFHYPNAIAVDANGTLYVAETGNNRVTKGSPTFVPGPAISLTVDSLGEAFGFPAGSGYYRATGSSPVPLTYQWLKDNVAIIGAITPNLVLYNLTSRAAGGNISVTVSNPYGAVTNSVGYLHVRVPQQLQPSRTPNGGFRLLSSDMDGGSIPTNALGNFVFEATSDVASTNWTRYTNGFTLTNGMVQFDDPDASSSLRRFYRVIER